QVSLEERDDPVPRELRGTHLVAGEVPGEEVVTSSRNLDELARDPSRGEDGEELGARLRGRAVLRASDEEERDRDEFREVGRLDRHRVGEGDRGKPGVLGGEGESEAGPVGGAEDGRLR